jgi:hypothetical protein
MHTIQKIFQNLELWNFANLECPDSVFAAVVVVAADSWNDLIAVQDQVHVLKKKKTKHFTKLYKISDVIVRY